MESMSYKILPMNNRLQATAGGLGGTVPRVGRSHAAPDAER